MNDSSHTAARENSTSRHAHSRPAAHLRLLVAMGVVYGAWLVWLSFIAWVNIQAGNQ